MECQRYRLSSLPSIAGTFLQYCTADSQLKAVCPMQVCSPWPALHQVPHPLRASLHQGWVHLLPGPPRLGTAAFLLLLHVLHLPAGMFNHSTYESQVAKQGEAFASILSVLVSERHAC